jgi:hypothetical protein
MKPRGRPAVGLLLLGVSAAGHGALCTGVWWAAAGQLGAVAGVCTRPINQHTLRSCA